MVMTCVMRHARTPKFQLSGSTVQSLYCGLEKCSISLVGILMTSICKVIPMSVLLEMLLIQLKPLTALVFKARINNGNAFSMFFPVELFVTSRRENN